MRFLTLILYSYAMLLSIDAYSQNIDIPQLFQSREYNQVVLKTAQNDDELHLIALSYQKLGRVQESIQIFEKLYSRNPVDKIILYDLANLYRLRKEYKKSLDLYHTLIQIDSNKTNYWYEIGNLYLTIKDKPGVAKEVLKDWTSTKSTSKMCESMAMNAYTKAVEIDSLNLSARYHMAKLMEGAPQSIKHLEFIIEKDSLYKQAIFQLAYVYYLNDRHAQAEKTFTYYIKYFPVETYVQKVRGLNAFKMDSFMLSKKIFESLAPLQDEPMPHYYLALIAAKEEKPKEQERQFTLMTKEILDRSEEQYMLAYIAFLERKDVHKAKNVYECVLTRMDNPEILYEYARFAEGYYKDKQIALNYYNKYLNEGNLKNSIKAEERISIITANIHMNK